MNIEDHQKILSECHARHDAEVDSLRQQLTAVETRLEEKTAECQSFYEEAERVIKQRDDHIKREVMMRDAVAVLEKFASTVAPSSSFWDEVWPKHEEELAATADLDGLILCHAEPAAIVYLDYGGNGAVLQTELADDEPLYRAWEPKK